MPAFGCVTCQVVKESSWGIIKWVTWVAECRITEHDELASGVLLSPNCVSILLYLFLPASGGTYFQIVRWMFAVS